MTLDTQEIGKTLKNTNHSNFFKCFFRKPLSRSKTARKTPLTFIDLTYLIAPWIALWNEACLLQAQFRLSISDATWWYERLIACNLAVYATMFHHG